MNLDPVEQNEVRHLLQQYQMTKPAKILLDHLFHSSGLLNKTSLVRNGYSDEYITKQVDKLRKVFKDYE